MELIVSLAMEEDDKLDRYPPTIEYLQKLGPSELPLILETSKWIFKEDPGMGLKVNQVCQRKLIGVDLHC